MRYKRYFHKRCVTLRMRNFEKMNKKDTWSQNLYKFFSTTWNTFVVPIYPLLSGCGKGIFGDGGGDPIPFLLENRGLQEITSRLFFQFRKQIKVCWGQVRAVRRCSNIFTHLLAKNPSLWQLCVPRHCPSGRWSRPWPCWSIPHWLLYLMTQCWFKWDPHCKKNANTVCFWWEVWLLHLIGL